MKKELRKRNTLGPVRTGAVEMAKTDTVGTIEIGAENTAKTGATGAVGEMAVGISVSATTSSSSKVSAIRGIYIQNKGRPHQRGDTDIDICIKRR